MFVGAALIAVAAIRLPDPVGVLPVLAVAATLLRGALAVYCFWLLLKILPFWLVRVDFLVELFEGTYQAGRWPVTTYPGRLRIGLTLLVPPAFAIAVPATMQTGRISG